jgi:hypothetical protein
MTAPCPVKDGFSEAAMPGRKQVFFEKKNQKTFVPGRPAISSVKPNIGAPTP